MVLVKVIELIVHVDRGLNFAINLDLCCTKFANFAGLVILENYALDAFAHYVQSDTKGQENKSKDAKNDHGGSEGGHGSPGGKHLLLELALLQLLEIGRAHV